MARQTETCEYCETLTATSTTNAGHWICDDCWEQGEDGFEVAK